MAKRREVSVADRREAVLSLLGRDERAAAIARPLGTIYGKLWLIHRQVSGQRGQLGRWGAFPDVGRITSCFAGLAGR